MTRITDPLDFGSGLDIAARSSASISKLQVPENQDNLLIIDAHGRAVLLRDQAAVSVMVPGWPRGHVRLAVLDGMGGHGQGRQAAEAAAEGLLGVPACERLDQLCAHLDALHGELQRRFRQPGDSDTFRRPGTTLTLLEIAPGQAPLLYHVGDSRLYEITGEGSEKIADKIAEKIADRIADTVAGEVAGRTADPTPGPMPCEIAGPTPGRAPGEAAGQAARPLTVDHVPATSFALHGLLGEQEWWQQVHGEHRAQISQAYILGNAFANPQVLDNGLLALDTRLLPPFLAHLADRRALAVRPGATYLLATDGFWSCGQPRLWTRRWPALLARPGDSASAALDALFNDYADHPPPDLHIDNLSAIVLRFAAPPAPPAAAARHGNIDETALPAAPNPAHSWTPLL